MENSEDLVITPRMIRSEVEDNCRYWGRTFSSEDIQKIAVSADCIIVNDRRYQAALVDAMDNAIEAHLAGAC